MKSHSPDTIQKIALYLQDGKSTRETSRALGISVGAVLRIREKEKENIPTPKIGRPSKVSKAAKTYLAKKFDTGQIKTIESGQKLLQSTEGVRVHTRTVWNYLKEEGLKGYVSPKKPWLTDKQKDARLKFAKDHITWECEDWKRVMFSDETIFSRVGSFGKTYYYKRPESRDLQPHQIQNTMQGGGGKLMMWGCMSYYGVGDVCWIPGKINSAVYVEVLDDYVLASRDWCCMDPTTFIFQQDNARVHTTCLVKDFFTKYGIVVLEWPANSPDLSPIENIWAFIKRRLSQYPEEPKNLEELWKRIQDIWTNIPIEVIHKLYAGMQKRMQMVIQNKGGHIKH